MNVELQYLPNRPLFKINVCRLCSLIRDKVLPIFDNAGSKVDLKLKECFPNLNIVKGDSKPQYICIDCITKLNMFNEFYQVCIESECKFDNYVKQYVEEQETLLKSALLQNSHGQSTVWVDDNNRARPNEDGVIVLSKMDSGLREPSIQDFVVMVELKYKSDPTISCDSQGYTLNKNVLNESNNNLAGPKCPPSGVFKEPTALMELSQRPSVSSAQPSTGKISDLTNNREPKDKKSFDCAICGRSFTRKTRLNSHISGHRSVKLHQCEKCRKKFLTQLDLASHQRSHSEAMFCTSCSKSFSSRSKLVRHLRVHTGEKPFLCVECGKCFGEKRNLDNHTRAHSGDKPYTCTICSKSFGVRSHLKDHLIVHNKSTPRFNCPTCSKSFKWKTNYNRHQKANHQKELS